MCFSTAKPLRFISGILCMRTGRGSDPLFLSMGGQALQAPAFPRVSDDDALRGFPHTLLMLLLPGAAMPPEGARSTRSRRATIVNRVGRAMHGEVQRAVGLMCDADHKKIVATGPSYAAVAN